jgi:hypothetical protein
MELNRLSIYDDRPRTRGDCIGAERPCPWASCKYHLAVETTAANAIKSPLMSSALFEGALDEEVERWTSRVADRICEMAESCALDIADRGGITFGDFADIAGLTPGQMRSVLERATVKLRDGLEEYRDHKPSETHHALSDLDDGEED